MKKWNMWWDILYFTKPRHVTWIFLLEMPYLWITRSFNWYMLHANIVWSCQILIQTRASLLSGLINLVCLFEPGQVGTSWHLCPRDRKRKGGKSWMTYSNVWRPNLWRSRTSIRKILLLPTLWCRKSRINARSSEVQGILSTGTRSGDPPKTGVLYNWVENATLENVDRNPYILNVISIVKWL